MTNAGLLGPYRLSVDIIDATIVGNSPAGFALGHLDRSGRFCLSRVGRADSNLAASLRAFIGTELMFKFKYFHTSEEAFLKECELFHAFNPPGNRTHPARSAGTRWTCPQCVMFERKW